MSLGLCPGTVRLAPAEGGEQSAPLGGESCGPRGVGALPAAVEHVGSTAVPALPAKPILDLLAGRPVEGALAPYVAACEAAGYRYRGESGIPGRHYFVRDAPDGRRTHHLHLVEHGGAFWRSHLAFRDYLRRVPARAAAYAALKRELASRHPGDRTAYTEGKAAFVAETLALAAGAPGRLR